MRPIDGIAVLAFAAAVCPAPLPGQAAPPSRQSPSATPTRTGTKAGAAACQVEGVWELISAADDGRERPLQGMRERKIVSRGHFVWLGEPARRDTITLRTQADSLRATRVTGGAGTYSLSGDTYTERLDYFFEPSMEGQRFPATCRVEGDRWYHTYPPRTGLQNARNEPSQTVEVWRRIR